MPLRFHTRHGAVAGHMLDVAPTAAMPRRLTTIRAHAREPTVLGPPAGCRVCVPWRGAATKSSDQRRIAGSLSTDVDLLTAGQDPLARRRAMSVTGHGTVQLTGVLISARSCASLRQRPTAVSASLSHARKRRMPATRICLQSSRASRRASRCECRGCSSCLPCAQ